MADLTRQRERQIVEEGRKQGKSDDFIKQAVLRDREASLPEIQQPEEEKLLSPSTILSTIGDIAGGDIGPLSALGAGIGEFAGELIEGSDVKTAGKEALKAGAIAGVTPVIFTVGFKLAKPAFKIPGKFVKDFFGRNLTKLGNSVLAKLGGQASKRGINVFDEMGRLGVSSVKRKDALKIINKGFDVQEKVIKEGIETAGNPVIMTKKELSRIFGIVKENVLDATDKVSLDNLEKAITAKFGNVLKADDALVAKRLVFKKASGSSIVNEQKRNIARGINSLLKDKVKIAKEGLREEEILFYMKDIFTRLKNQEFVKSGFDLNIIKLPKDLLNIAGPRVTAGVGQFFEKVGQGLSAIPGVIPEQGIRNVIRGVRQPLREQALPETPQPLQ